MGPVVLYNGRSHWTAAQDVEPLVEPMPGGLERYRPRLAYLLIDEGRYTEEQLAPLHNVAAALFRLENSRTPTDVQRVVAALGILHMNAQHTYDADTLMQRITIDPNLCHGKPCIRGLRYPVESLLELLSAGMTIEEILADYEDLERADILAVLAFATRLSQVKRMQPIAV